MSTTQRSELLKNYFENYRKSLNDLMDSVDLDVLEQIIARFVQAYRENKTVYVCGNGGSAATASHFQVDFGFFVRYFTNKRMKFRSLTDQVPMITAIGNDHSYEDIFVDQLIDNFEPGDVLVGISASGNSMNVVKAVEYANEMDGTSIGLVGFKGGKLKEVSQICLYTPNPEKEYGPIEDLHMIIDHMMVNFIVTDEEFLSIGKA